MLMRFAAWKVTLIVLTLLAGAFLSVPNLLTEEQNKEYLGWWPTGPMKLGLDLRGGGSILLEVDPAELQANKIKELSRDVREALRARPQIPVRERQSEPTELIVKLGEDADIAEALKRIKKVGDPPVGTIGGVNSLNVKQIDSSTVSVAITDAALNKIQIDALSNSMEAVRKRVDASGMVEPNIQKQGDNRIVVEVPGIDEQQMNVLVDTLTQAGVLTFQMADETANPIDYVVGEARNGRIALPDDSMNGQILVLFEDQIINGSDLQGARSGFDDSNRPNISFQLRPGGAKRFGDASTKNVGKRFAIVLDDRIVSAPNIISPITTGNGQITGSFTPQEAEQLAIVLRSGALPAKLQVAERRVVGAGLGADSIRMGVNASIVGVTLVAIFMIGAYGLLGIFAVIALLLNLVMMLGVLSGFGATLTLPGIAGILLTMGMAVDYNVLIFERIREEKRNGRSPPTSVEVGYKEAMSTIIDANVTHLVAASVMFMLGSGPIKGFALTLAIGIITSFFTAVIVARWIMAGWLRTARPKYIPI